MIRRRVHVGCGIRNPVRNRHLWVLDGVAQLISWPVNLLVNPWLGYAGYLPWLVAIAVSLRREAVHSPSKMYRTWYP
jgi:hypothetical protein